MRIAFSFFFFFFFPFTLARPHFLHRSTCSKPCTVHILSIPGKCLSQADYAACTNPATGFFEHVCHHYSLPSAPAFTLHFPAIRLSFRGSFLNGIFAQTEIKWKRSLSSPRGFYTDGLHKLHVKDPPYAGQNPLFRRLMARTCQKKKKGGGLQTVSPRVIINLISFIQADEQCAYTWPCTAMGERTVTMDDSFPSLALIFFHPMQFANELVSCTVPKSSVSSQVDGRRD